FARQWLAGGHEVFALSRDPRSSKGLAGLAKAHPATLHMRACEVTSDASVNEARRAVEAAWDRLDILVNNAAVYGGESRDVASLDLDEIRRTFEINTLAPLRMARAFQPLLRKGDHPRVIHITSLMGSIDDNRSGGRYAYRVSKAALNMVSRNLAHDFKKDGILSVALHPGWVRTDMGGPDAPLGAEEAVASLIRTIAALETAHNGGFYDREGRPQPW
ncbi:MAG: hypothetical protein DMF50_11215, partial [Acidobacteria bacterium]